MAKVKIEHGKKNSSVAPLKGYSVNGISFSFPDQPLPSNLADAFDLSSKFEQYHHSVLIFLLQLVEEGFAQLDNFAITITWENFYQLIQNEVYSANLPLLSIPEILPVLPAIYAKGALADKNFHIYIGSWMLDGQTLRNTKQQSALLHWGENIALMSLPVWKLVCAIDEFSARTMALQTQVQHELAWGRIRNLINNAGAVISSKYLLGTIVLTPESLRLLIVKKEIIGEKVILVNPTFEHAPNGWLDKFDSYHNVQEHYDFTLPIGRCRVILTGAVQKVLNIIKKEMPGRRVAGTKAEAFIRNPFAVLGEDAHDVIDENTFVEDKMAAGFFSTTFNISSLIEAGRIQNVFLVVTSHIADDNSTINKIAFNSAPMLEQFLHKLTNAILDERQLLPWSEYDLELDGDAQRHLEEGQNIYQIWCNQDAVTIRFEDIYQLENYGKRIVGIGIAAPIYIPVISRPTEGEASWAPDEIKSCISVTLPGQQGQVIIPLEKTWLAKFEQKINSAEKTGAATVIDEKLPSAIKTPDARRLLDSLLSINGATDIINNIDKSTSQKSLRRNHETLLVKHNLARIDYEEQRKQILTLPAGAKPIIPRSLKKDIHLLPHQKVGLAWLQHLFSNAPQNCRGALLADDMGLGKTLQLLTFLAAVYEDNPNAGPSLIVAPVSLLDNWLSETIKFFDSTFPKLLCLYADSLHALKQPKEYIDKRLIEDKGITNLLKPDWLANAKIVLTTYETLRDYEFSLARQDFKIMICDEAQKVKTPNALVTLAAKKQKVSFKIACTGTPVENTLADIWCLFDFLQPGLLGSLDTFSRTYRRPIEAKSTDQKKAIEQLREAIAPQLLRRTKKDIAKELPKKELKRLEIELSNFQRQLYIDGLRKLRAAGLEQDGRKRGRITFDVLHFIKAVCAEPYCLPRTRFYPDPKGHVIHLENSVKIAWLIEVLMEIKLKDEKVIVFTELREVQVALSYFLKEEFGIHPYIINGNTKSRQELIDRFQATNGFDVIILSPLAAGFGLNIVAANHVIHFTRMWNPAKEAQATDRAYRIGAKKDVFVYCPIVVATDFTTFEAKLDSLLEYRMALAEDMLNGSGDDISISELTPEGPDGAGIEDRRITINEIDLMDGNSFEVFCKILWSKNNSVVYVTEKKRGDGGIDVVAINGSTGQVLQCKTAISQNRILGWDAIKEVVAGSAKYHSIHPGVAFEKLAVTNQQFNENAKNQAALNNVKLIERPEIERMIEEFPIFRSEFDSELIRMVT